jgi:lipopolysaccharide/colanic/teichoic acid biosynthesis glycosyltransferase
MNNNLDMHGKLLPDSERITRFGSFLRSSSLDELPSLLNVLIGDMSLVGPRPLLVEYLERYDANQMKRHNVRPGITGLAQINGRNNITWDEKFTYDVEYVEKQNIILDFSILFKTVLKVISKSDINSSLEETMPTFKGTKKNG